MINVNYLIKNRLTLLSIILIQIFCLNNAFSQGQTTRTYYYGHSLINHTLSPVADYTNIPYWMAEFESANGNTYESDGYFTSFHAANDWQINGTDPLVGPHWGFANHDQAWNSTFANTNYDQVVMTEFNPYPTYHGYDIQWNHFYEAVNGGEYVFDAVLAEEPTVNLYIYECWMQMTDNSTNPSLAQWAEYYDLCNGGYHDFYLFLQDSLIERMSNPDIKLIPASDILAELYFGVLSDMIFDDWREDSQHGTPSAYLVAAMIVYAAFNQEAPPTITLDPAIIEPEIIARYDTISTVIMSELAAFNFSNGSSRVWFADADDENPVQGGSLTASNVTYNSAELNWDDATDNVGVTAYDIFIDGALHDNSVSSSYTFTDLDCNTSYSNVQVRARDAVGNTSGFISTSFTTASCPVDNDPPTAPTGLSTERINNSSAFISWDPSTDNYEVESYTISIDGSEIGTQADTSYTLTGLSCDQSYQISVYASDIFDNSSTAASITETHTCVTEYTLTIIYDNSIGNIQVDPNNGTYSGGQYVGTFEEGTEISCYEYGQNGYDWDRFTGDIETSDHPATFTMNGNITITGHFTQTTPSEGKILTWDCPDNSTSVVADSIASGLESSTIDINSHLNAGSFGEGLEVTNFTSATLDEAITNGDYIYFTVSPQSDKMVSITAVNLRPMSQNRDRAFALFSSQNGFSVSQLIGTVTYMGVTSDLLEIAVSNHNDLETETEFRIYIYGDVPNQYESAGLTGTGNDLEVIGAISDIAVTPTYVLSVTNGTNAGDYEEGTTVSITANNAPSGQEFSHWNGDNQYLSDSTSATTTLTMPTENISLTAIYVAVPTQCYENKAALSIYPNPANHMVVISSSTEIKNIILLDLNGKVISEKTIFSKESSLNVRDLPGGIYFANISLQDNSLRTLRLIKK